MSDGEDDDGEGNSSSSSSPHTLLACVMSIISSTSLELMSAISPWNNTTLSLSPFTMACRCLAIP